MVEAEQPSEPRVPDDVAISTRDTVIGKGTVVAGNVFVLESTPPDSLVTRVEGGVVVRTRQTPATGAGI